MDQGRESKLSCWVDVSPGSDFPIQNLPYGVFRRASGLAAVGVRIGDNILDLAAIHEAGLFEGTSLAATNVFAQSSLNAFMAMGRKAWTEARRRITDLLCDTHTSSQAKSLCHNTASLRHNDDLRDRALVNAAEVEMLLPVKIGDFTDFYSSIEHATNVGKMFRDPANALLPNWKHLPVGYHGRAGSVFVSGVNIRRPMGQTKADDAELPTFGPSRRLDFELEVGFFVGTGNQPPLPPPHQGGGVPGQSPLAPPYQGGVGGVPGEAIPTHEAADHIFGMVLLNDWSARDIQQWEYVPLGPFLGKSFATSIGKWVVTLDALAPFRVPGPVQQPAVLPYLQYQGDWAYDINLEVWLKTANATEPIRICKTNFRTMYWNILQQLAHHTAGGTLMRTGDLCGSGTVSGATDDSFGSMLEICFNSTRPMQLPNGEKRSFIQDGDTVIIKGWCQGNGYRVGLGEVRATVLPARP